MRALAPYLLGVAITVVAAVVLLRLPEADLRVPFTYGGDVMFYLAVVKSLIEHGRYLHNDSLGMPFGADLHDFPMPDNLSYAVLKVMALVFRDPGLVVNLFFLLTFPLTTVAAFWALTRLPVSTGPALCCALLYSFSNYHVNRSVNHLMYTAYFAVPLVIALALRLSQATPRPRGVVAGLAICIVTASTGGAYNTCFTVFVLGGAAVLRALESRSWRAAAAPLAFAAFTLLVMVANVLPTILYRAEHGTVEVAQRITHDAETFALKPAQLVLPICEHRVQALADLRARYNAGPLHNENLDCTLGFVGAFGFVALLAWLLFGRAAQGPRTAARRLWDHLSALNALCLAVGTVGGLGAIVALFVSPQIRGYNRISTFLLFLSLGAAALALERLAAAARGSPAGRWAVRATLAGLTVLGLLDQVPSRPLLPFEPTIQNHREDAEFFSRVEAATPAGAMVFQVPIWLYPEGDYEHLKAYLHTRGLRWSFGAMMHRPSYVWQQRVMAQPLDRAVELLATAGFAGVVVDRSGLPQQGADFEAGLIAAGAAPVGSSRSGRWSHFDLAAKAARLEQDVTPDEWRQRRFTALNSLTLDWGHGFYPPASAELRYRWSERRSVLRLEALSAEPQRGELLLSLASLHPGWVVVRTRWHEDKVALPGNGHPTPYARDLLVPPGRHDVELLWQPLSEATRSGWPPFCVDAPRAVHRP